MILQYELVTQFANVNKQSKALYTILGGQDPMHASIKDRAI
jgi:hypothetical protein